MRKSLRLAGILAIMAAPLAAGADEPPLPKRELPRPVPPVISTHQIDRYDAINKIQQTLRSNPTSLADWVILGELAHEVALDLPPDQAAAYADVSRNAYEKALALKPDNVGLKAAVQFARDQEANATRFHATRNQATQTYLEARRRDLAAMNYSPSLRVFGGPTIPSMTPVVPDPAQNALTGTPANLTVPARTLNPLPPDNVPGTVAAKDAPTVTHSRGADLDTANFGTQQVYSAPSYQMYYVPDGNPYTYHQYSNGYYVPSTSINPALLPMTMQRYSQSLLQRPVPPR